MKSKEYYGIGNDEYNYWKTTDNGKTWNYWKPGSGKIIIKDDKIIKDGIIHSEDNGDTWKDDDLPTGILLKGDNPDPTGKIWANIKHPIGLPSNEIPYINDETSILNEGTYNSDDNGETWKKISPDIGDKVETDKDGNTIIKSKKGILSIDKDGNKKLDILSDLYDKFFTMSIGDILLYILNKIILPKLTFMLLEQKDVNDLKYDNFVNHLQYFTDSEIYKTNFEGIDYMLDVGMRPLTIESLKEFKDAEITKNELMDELSENEIREKQIDEMLNTNVTLKKTFNIIDLQLNITKDYALKHELQTITNRDESYEGIRKEDISVMKMYYNIQKGTEESIIGTIINSIFNFNNSKKMALLKTSIIETAYRLKERINIKLNIIYDKIHSGIYNKEEIIQSDYFKNILNFNLKEEWANSLTKCTQDYYLTALNNIFKIGKDNDKGLISIAVDKYKFFKDDFMKKAKNTVAELRRIDIITNNNELEELNSSLNNIIKNFYNNVTFIINDNNLEKELNELYDQYIVDESELLKKANIIINNILSKLSGNLRYYIDKNIFLNGFDDIFDDIDYQENFNGLTSGDVNKTYDYFKDIVNEFKNRCVQLYKISGDNMIPYFIELLKNKTELRIWIDNLLSSEDKNQFLTNNKLNYLLNNTKDSLKDINKVVEEEWNNMRDII